MARRPAGRDLQAAGAGLVDAAGVAVDQQRFGQDVDDVGVGEPRR